MELLAQVQARSFERVGVMTPVAPAGSNGHDDGVHQGDLPQVLENLRVLVILNAVADGLQADARFASAKSTNQVGGKDHVERTGN